MTTPNYFLFLLIVLWIVSQCSYRKDAYVIFDKFHFNDIFSLYQKQLFTKTCSMQDGPNCYQISSSSQFDQSPEVKDALAYFGDRIEIDTLSDYIANVVSSFRDEHKSSSTVSQVALNLLLTFESYDEATRHKDIYMPEEKIVRFNVGLIKLSFIGKLRLKNLNEKNPTDKKTIEPQLTFGIIEGKELIIKFDKPLSFNYVYIRPQETIKSNLKVSIVAYSKEDKELYRVTETIVPRGRKWTKVIGKDTVLIDSIKLPGDIEIDNLSVTETQESEDIFEHKNIQKIIEKAIGEYMKQNKEDKKNNQKIHIINIDDL